jgi:hypothetical protein
MQSVQILAGSKSMQQVEEEILQTVKQGLLAWVDLDHISDLIRPKPHGDEEAVLAWARDFADRQGMDWGAEFKGGGAERRPRKISFGGRAG